MVTWNENDSVLRQICPPFRQGSARQMGQGSGMLRWWGLVGAPAPPGATLTGSEKSRLVPVTTGNSEYPHFLAPSPLCFDLSIFSGFQRIFLKAS